MRDYGLQMSFHLNHGMPHANGIYDLGPIWLHITQLMVKQLDKVIYIRICTEATKENCHK